MYEVYNIVFEINHNVISFLIRIHIIVISGSGDDFVKMKVKHS